MPIESLPGQMPLFAEEDPYADYRLDAEQRELLGDIATLSEHAAKSLLSLLLLVQFGEAFEEQAEAEAAAEGTAWKSTLIPRCIRRRGTFC